MLKETLKTTNISTFKKNFKSALDNVCHNQETLLITRPEDENVVVISESAYNEILKQVNN